MGLFGPREAIHAIPCSLQLMKRDILLQRFNADTVVILEDDASVCAETLEKQWFHESRVNK